MPQAPSVNHPQYAVVAGPGTHTHACARCTMMNGNAGGRICFAPPETCPPLTTFQECEICHISLKTGCVNNWGNHKLTPNRVSWLITWGYQCPGCGGWGVLATGGPGSLGRKCLNCGVKAVYAVAPWGHGAWQLIAGQQGAGAGSASAPPGKPTCQCNPCANQLS